MTEDEVDARVNLDLATDNLAGGDCPFCGRKIMFPRRLNGQVGYVMHEAPACTKYQESTPEGFMASAAAVKLARKWNS